MSDQATSFFGDSKRRQRWLGFLASFFLFAFLPLTLGWFLLDAYFLQEESLRDQKIVGGSRQFLEKIGNWSEVSFQLERRFQFLRNAFNQRAITAPQLPRLAARLRKAWGFTFAVYHFAENGELVTPVKLPGHHGGLIKQFWPYLSQADNRLLAGQLDLIKSLFGDTWETLRHIRGRIQEFRGMEKSGFLFWDYDFLSNNGGIVFIVWDPPQPLDLVRARLQNASLSQSLEIFAESQTDPVIPLHGIPGAHNLELVPHLLKQADQPLVRYQGKTWVSWPAKDLRFFLGVVEKPSTIEVQRRATNAAILLLGLLSAIFGFRWIVLGKDAYLSIRVKLIFLFLYALMIPFMGILALSYKTFRETEQILLDELHKEGTQTIKTIDDGFLNEPLRLQKIFAQYHRLFTTLPAQLNFQQIMVNHIWDETFTTFELRGSNGETLMNLGSSASSDEAIGKVIRQFFLNAIKRYLPERAMAGGAQGREGVSDLYIQSLVESSVVGFSTMLEVPGVARLLMMPKRDMFFFWNYYSDPQLPAPIIFGTTFLSLSKDWYLKKAFLSVNDRQSRGNQLFTFDRTGTFWIPFHGFFSANLQKFAQRIRLSDATQTDRLIWQGKPWIAVGSPGKQIPEYSYLVLLPEHRLTKPLDELKQRIFLGLGFVLLLTVLFGWILANLFLAPIKQLGLGILAIQTKNSRFRLPPFQKDEFGDLSRAFNDMMENLDELNAGKLVQEELFPKTVLVQGDYRAFGISRPATDLGGDYFDYLRIDDRQFLVLMGDVTGHGIPAALIMAMSKAVIATFPREGFQVERLLEKLNFAIHSVMKGKRLMTMAFLLVNSVTHEATFYQFGHPLPIRWSSNGATHFFNGQGSPLGISAKLRSKPFPFSLAPGERVVLYTDGLVESFSLNSHDDGFLLFQNFVSRQPWLPISEACAALIDNHPFFLRRETQPDDFTIVILERTNQAITAQ